VKVRANVTIIMKIEDTPFPLTFLVGWIFVNLCQISKCGWYNLWKSLWKDWYCKLYRIVEEYMSRLIGWKRIYYKEDLIKYNYIKRKFT